MTALITFDPDRFLRPDNASARPAVLSSSCLNGEPVRYDGRARTVTTHSLLAANLTLQPLCPETGAGLPVPRPPVQLVVAPSEPARSATPTSLRARGRDDPGLDVTDALSRYASASVTTLRKQRPRPAGYLWKSHSPSCGWGTTPLFDNRGTQVGTGDGIQAARVRAELPWLICRDEVGIEEQGAAEQFILLCRLVHDVINETVPLAQLRTAHQPLVTLLDDAALATLLNCVARNDRLGYAAALSTASASGSPAQWLALFGRRPAAARPDSERVG